MKILYLSHRVPYPPNKGEKIRSYHQVTYLVESGHQLFLASPWESSSDAQHAAELAKHLSVQVQGRVLQHKWLRMLIALLKGQPLSTYSFYSKSLQALIDHTAQEHQVDLVICSCSSMADYIFRTSSTRLKTITKLMDFMDLDSAKWAAYAERKSFPMSWIYAREASVLSDFERHIIQAFDTCLFISDAESKQLPHQEKIVTVGNGIDMEVFKPGTDVRESIASPVFIFSGVMDYFPNEDAVVWFCEEVWPAIIAKWPKAVFYIAGMNPSNKVCELADRPGIVVTGFVDDIVEYYHKADIFIAPFRIARGVQNKVLQAFACGLPVITSPLGIEGIECVPGRDALVASSQQDYIDHITQLVDDSTHCKGVREAALSLVKDNYSWYGHLKQLDGLLVAKQAD